MKGGLDMSFAEVLVANLFTGVALAINVLHCGGYRERII